MLGGVAVGLGDDGEDRLEGTVERLVLAEVVTQHGPVHGLVNNAGGAFDAKPVERRKDLLAALGRVQLLPRRGA